VFPDPVVGCCSAVERAAVLNAPDVTFCKAQRQAAGVPAHEHVVGPGIV
jgi:hypothetical protein